MFRAYIGEGLYYPVVWGLQKTIRIPIKTTSTMKKVRPFFFWPKRGVFVSWFKAKSLEDASDDATEALKLSETQGLSRITSDSPQKNGALFCDQYIIWGKFGIDGIWKMV